MGRLVDLDDITDAAGVAEIIGLSRGSNVSVYRNRYPDFPEPVVDLGTGRCLLWLRSDIQTWKRARGGEPKG
jgi:predicted DNA-binding transcriptional regulator AlpA